MITKYASNVDSYPTSQDEPISERRGFKGKLPLNVPRTPPVNIKLNIIPQKPAPKKALRGEELKKFMDARTIKPSNSRVSPEQPSMKNFDEIQSNSSTSLTPHGSTDSRLSTQAQTSRSGSPESLHVVETKTITVAAATGMIPQPAVKSNTSVQTVAVESVNHLGKWFTEFRYEPKVQQPVFVQNQAQFANSQFANRVISYPIQQAYAPVFGQRQAMYIRY